MLYVIAEPAHQSTDPDGTPHQIIKVAIVDYTAAELNNILNYLEIMAQRHPRSTHG